MSIKEIVKITKKAFLQGRFNWLIFIAVGGILYAVTQQYFWLIFGISFGVVFDKNDFLGKRNRKKEQEKE